MSYWNALQREQDCKSTELLQGGKRQHAFGMLVSSTAGSMVWWVTARRYARKRRRSNCRKRPRCSIPRIICALQARAFTTFKRVMTQHGVDKNPKSKIQNPKSKIQNPKSKIQNPKSETNSKETYKCYKTFCLTLNQLPVFALPV